MSKAHAKIARMGVLALATLAAATATATASGAPHRPDRARLQHALDAVVRGGAPGVIALVRDGRHSVRLASGYENLATRRPMHASDRFRVGSVTKTFVATAVLQLAGERRLALDDPIERWLPGLVPGGAGITIRQLLNHTSGLHDYADDAFVRRVLVARGNVWAPRGLIALGTRHPPLFAPGAGLAYSSTGYIVLGLIVEAVTGRPLAAELRQRIFAPLHLRATSLDAKPRITGRHAHGYTRYHGGLHPIDISDIGQSFAWAAGALVSTTDDLARFYRALLDGRLLRPDLLATMRTTVPADQQRWGLGLIQTPHRCGPSWGHGGETLGYEANADSSPDGTRQAIVAINADQSVLGTRRAQMAISRLYELAYCGSLAHTAAPSSSGTRRAGVAIARP
jgi:D-alanyl-D-alanine carboxypeptidase